MKLLRIAAFSDAAVGGNPAGVWLGDARLLDRSPSKCSTRSRDDARVMTEA